MPPKRKAGEVPKPMKDALKQLQEQGLELTDENIAGLDAKTRKAAFSSLHHSLGSGFPDQMARYREVVSEQEKRRWLIAFMVDPASGCSTIANTTERSSKDTTIEEDEWVTVK